MNNNPNGDVESIYEFVKDLSHLGEFKEAKEFLLECNFQELWGDLLEFAMIRHNCAVTKIVIGLIITSRYLSPSEIQKKVSEIDHKVQIDFNFNGRLRNYLNSEEFESNYEPYQNVRTAAKAGLQGRLGLPLLAPKEL